MATLQEHLKGKSRQYKQELARRLGITERSLQRYVTPKKKSRRSPDLEMVANIVEACGGEVTLESLIEGLRTAA